jgi:hypothetical protein
MRMRGGLVCFLQSFHKISGTHWGFFARRQTKTRRLFCPTSPAPFAKIYLFPEFGTQAYNRDIPRSLRRAYRDRHDTWCGMRWTRSCRKTCGTVAYGQAVWSCFPDAGINPGSRARGMVAKKPGTPGRARSSRKAIAQGVPGVSALPDDLCALYPFQHTRLRVRRAPGIPCALCFRRRDVDATTRAESRRGNERSYLFVIASQRVARMRAR